MKPLTLITAILFLGAANAQYWKPLGRGTIGPTGVRTLYGDSLSDRLLAGGTFTWILNEEDTVLGMGQAAWNGSRWDSLAHRIAPAVNQTFWFIRFKGGLYSSGGYIFLDGNGLPNSSFARLNESTLYWEALECTNPFPGSNLIHLVPLLPDTTLYATGNAGSLCGLPASCVFRYDGESFFPWPPFHELPEYANSY